MKLLSQAVIVVLVCFFTHHSYGFYGGEKTSLSGQVTDMKTGIPISGATIYFPELKVETKTDSLGSYRVSNLPATILLVQISASNYQLLIQKIDLTQVTIQNFKLEEAVAELNEVVISGNSSTGEKNRSSTPISTIPKIELLQNASTNIIDALAKQPGVSQITTGAGISKPVIRGLGFNRVVVVSDGIRQEGQQWGNEHGVEIDEFSIQKVEILKGPASLSYGSDAIAGVVNFVSNPILTAGTIVGNLLANYQTNNGLVGYSANFSGNKKGIVWDFRYSGKQAHAYKNKVDGYVFNSGFKEYSIGSMLGIHKSWGYMHLFTSYYQLKPGLVEGERDSLTGKFIKTMAVNDNSTIDEVVSQKDFLKYSISTPFQQINHFRTVLNNRFFVRKGNLSTVIGFQQNQRREFANVFTPKDAELHFLLNTINYDLRYNLPEFKKLNLSVGVNGMNQNSINKGEERLIPAYHLFDFGLFTVGKLNVNKWDFSGGIRYDIRTQLTQTDAVDSAIFNAFKRNFQGLSGSLGLTYQLSAIAYIKFNASKGYRAPNITELSANGVHEGSISFLKGSSYLKSESSWQFDLAFGINTKHVTSELNMFSNSITHYIYLQKLNSIYGGDSLSDGFRTFQYTSGNAQLLGGEFVIDIHPHPWDWLHFENSFSYVNALQRNQPDSMKYLPFTPAPKLVTELRATKNKLGKFLVNCYAKVEVENYFRQNLIYAAFDTETKTAGYSLLNVGIGGDVVSKNKTLFSIYISANNLTNTAYQSHLSRLKYAPTNFVTGRVGVFNMGRNVSIKVLIPLVFSQKQME